MSGRLLIVDGSTAGRIVLRAMIEAAGYGVDAALSVPDALARAQNLSPALIVYVDSPLADQRKRALADGLETRFSAVKAAFACPVIALTPDPGRRLALLQAGAEDVQCSPARQPVLLARIRAELRRVSEEGALALHEDAHHALGFAENPEAEHPRPPAVVTLIGTPASHETLRDKITALTRARAQCWPMGARSPARRGSAATDVFLIDARDIPLRADGAPILRVVPELRSDPDSAQAMQLVIFGPEHADFAVNALDMGADDVICEAITSDEIAHRVGILLRRKRASDRFRRGVRRGLKAAVTDPLTGLHNRRYALPKIAELAANHTRIDVLALDLDNFKQVNDQFGHSAGDDLLIGLADRLREALRPQDLIARIGGEEFVIALGSDGTEDARAIAERLRNCIAATPFHTSRSAAPLAITASIGVTRHRGPLTGDTTAESMIEQADDALYAAKAAGRNCVRVYQKRPEKYPKAV